MISNKVFLLFGTFVVLLGSTFITSADAAGNSVKIRNDVSFDGNLSISMDGFSGVTSFADCRDMMLSSEPYEGKIYNYALWCPKGCDSVTGSSFTCQVQYELEDGNKFRDAVGCGYNSGKDQHCVAMQRVTSTEEKLTIAVLAVTSLHLVLAIAAGTVFFRRKRRNTENNGATAKTEGSIATEEGV